MSSASQTQLDVDSPFVWEWRSGLAIVIVLVVGSLANSAGVGGGAIFVPVLQAVVGFGLKEATAVSQAMIASGGIVSVVINTFKRSPFDPEEPLINFSVALALIPVVLAGVAIGVLLNTIFPPWLITILLLILMILLVYQSLHKGITLWKRETRAKRFSEVGATTDGAVVNGDGTAADDDGGDRTSGSFDGHAGPLASRQSMTLSVDDSWQAMEGGGGVLRTRPSRAISVSRPRTSSTFNVVTGRANSDHSGMGHSYDCMEGAYLELPEPVGLPSFASPGRDSSSLSRAFRRLGSGVLKSPVAPSSLAAAVRGASGSRASLAQPLLSGPEHQYGASNATPARQLGVAGVRSLPPRRPQAVSKLQSSTSGVLHSMQPLQPVPEDTEQQAWIARRGKWRAHMFEVGELGNVPEQGQSLLERARSRRSSRAGSSRGSSASRLPNIRKTAADGYGGVDADDTQAEITHPLQLPPPPPDPNSLAAKLEALNRGPKVVNMRLPPVQPPLPHNEAQDLLAKFDSQFPSHAVSIAPQAAHSQQSKLSEALRGKKRRLAGEATDRTTSQVPTPFTSPFAAVSTEHVDPTVVPSTTVVDNSQESSGVQPHNKNHAQVVARTLGADARTSTAGARLSDGCAVVARESSGQGLRQHTIARDDLTAGVTDVAAAASPVPPLSPNESSRPAMSSWQLFAPLCQVIWDDLSILPGWILLAIVVTWIVFSGLQVGRSLVSKCSAPYWAIFTIQLVVMIGISAMYAHLSHSRADDEVSDPPHVDKSSSAADMRAADAAAPAGLTSPLPRVSVVIIPGGLDERHKSKVEQTSEKTALALDEEDTQGFTLGVTMAALTITLAIGCLAGLIGGLLGLGGGMLIGPLLLHLGAHPQVSAASSSLMVLFASAAAVVGFVVLGRLNVQYSLVLGGASALASILGVLLVSDLIRRTGRTSIVVFALCLVMVIALTIIASFGVKDMANDFRTGQNIGFGSLC